MNNGLKKCLICAGRWAASILAVFALSYGCGAKQETSALKNPKELVSEKNLVRLVQQMVRINSEFSKGILHNNKEMAEFLGKELRAIGVEVEGVYPKEPFEAPYHRGLGVKYTGGPSDFPVVVARLRGTTGKPEGSPGNFTP